MADFGGSPPASATAAAGAWLDAVCDMVIPDADTPGARKAGVAAFVQLAASHGLAGSSAADLVGLKTQLDQARGPFEHLAVAAQHDVLVMVDGRDATNRSTPWAHVKKLILMGYYTSEIGASQELRYQLVPGRFDPDLPVHPGDRAWSSDWIGRGF